LGRADVLVGTSLKTASWLYSSKLEEKDTLSDRLDARTRREIFKDMKTYGWTGAEMFKCDTLGCEMEKWQVVAY